MSNNKLYGCEHEFCKMGENKNLCLVNNNIKTIFDLC